MSTQLIPVKTTVARGRKTKDNPQSEVVSEQELRYRDQLKPKAKVPDAVFETAEPVEEPLVPGVTVNCETMLGFLAAMDRVIREGLEKKERKEEQNAKISFETGSDPQLVMECVNPNIWSAVGIKATAISSDGFVAMLPLRQAMNVLNAIRTKYKSVTIGLAKDGIGLGPHCIPYGGKPQNFPLRPEIRDFKARIAMPAYYLEQICKRVMPARAKDTETPELSSVLLDFVQPANSAGKVMCVALATDGHRMHVLELPQAVVDPKSSGGHLKMPPAVMVPHEFFGYLQAVVDREWTGIELSEEQVNARGDDYMVIAKTVQIGKSTVRSAMNWRKVDVVHKGHWTVDKIRFAEVVKEAVAIHSTIQMRLDSLRDELEIRVYEQAGRFLKRISVKRIDGPPDLVEVKLDGRFLLDVFKSCTGGLLRLGFAHSLEKQKNAPIIIRDDEERFRAIIMPLL